MENLKNNKNVKCIDFVAMGMEIDHNKGLNHRIRTIFQAQNGDWLFIELLQGTRPNIRYTNYKKEADYLEKFPNENYIYIDFLFRVDVPEDYYKNFSKEYQTKDCFYELEYTKENIVKLLQQYNPNIECYNLVNNNFLEDLKEQGGFYRLYDLKLEHTVEPIKIINMSKYEIILESIYSCWNYNKTILYSEKMRNTVGIEELPRLQELYGIDTINILIEEYKERNILKKE